MGFVRLSGLILLLAAFSPAAPPTAERLAKDAERAERAGETVRAYLLYARAAVADRRNPKYWAKAESLRPLAEAQSAERLPHPELLFPERPLFAGSNAGIVGSFTEQDLQDLDRMKPPPRLRPTDALKSFHLKADAKTLFEQVAREFGYTVIFDKDYNPTTGPIRFQVEDAGYREALHALESATDSFIVPIADTAMLVAQDTPQKRTEVESDEALSIPIPQRTSVQEAQELLMLVQQAFEIRRAVLDPQRHSILLRDRVSKVETAAMLLNQLSGGRPQVSIEVQFLSAAATSSMSLGLALPTQFPLVNFGSILHSSPSIPAGFAKFLMFGAGKTFFGLGVTDAQLFATATRSSATSLLTSTMMASDGQPASMHIGDKYPIVTGAYTGLGGTGTGGTGGGGTTYAVLSTTSYVDLTSSPVSTTGSMKLVVNSFEIPFVLPAGHNNLVGLEAVLNSLQGGVYASVVQRGTNARPISLVVVATSLGVTSIQLIDDPTTAKIELLKPTNVVSAISADFADATKTKASTTGALSLAVGSTKTYPLTLTTDLNNLNGLRDAINAASAGVTASVLLSNSINGAMYLQVVANAADSGQIQLYDDPTGANTALLTPTEQVNQAGTQFGQTVARSTGTSGIGQIYTPPPTFNFEDLGLVMKVTPYVHSLDEVSLEIEAEFKVLGSGSFNGVPVISTRKFQGKVRLRTSEWAVVAGLVSSTQSRNISGIAGLMQIPGLGYALRDNETSKDENNVLIVIKPHVTNLPASEYATRTFWVGTETRPLSPL